MIMFTPCGKSDTQGIQQTLNENPLPFPERRSEKHAAGSPTSPSCRLYYL